ncbi:signal peptidase II [Rubritalea marina]|uniref:signal peptidase II n=1 Tax=Rubritalea marina TaxID=361055 RepID=UPI0003711D7F|nr:signal peptidase II [Rubritalea marina]
MQKLLPLLLKVSLPLVVIDQITKWLVVLNFKQPYLPHKEYPYLEPIGEFQGKYWLASNHVDQIPVIEGFFNIVRVHNQGVAFGMGNGSSWAPVVFLIVPFVALFVVRMLWKNGVFVGIAKWSAPLLVAGVLGNLIDRLLQGFFLKGYESYSFWGRLSEGYVVDFIDVTIPFINYRWPSFNVADSCICIAASLLFISAFRTELDDRKVRRESA